MENTAWVIPKAVKRTAQLAVALKKRGFAGGVGTGIGRARQLASCKRIPVADAHVMRNWFARHGPNASNGGTSYRGYVKDLDVVRPVVNAVVRGTKTPAQGASILADELPKSSSRGLVAWLLWGGDAAYKWIWVSKYNEPSKLQGGAKLCSRGVNAAKAKFDVWPSAYASGYASQVCRGTKPGLDGKKRADRGYLARLNNEQRPKQPSGIDRWFKEKWVDACTIGQKGGPKPCGRQKGSSRSYPYCRPTFRITPLTPVTWKEMSKEDIAKTCRKKKRRPSSRMSPAAATRRRASRGRWSSKKKRRSSRRSSRR